MSVFAVAMVAVMVTMALALVRALRGPTIFDRILAVNAFGTKTVLIIALHGFLTGRPEFLDISPTPRDDAVPTRLMGVQDLGNFKLVTVRLGPHEVTAKLPEGAPVPTDEAHLVFQPEWTRLYADDRLVG